MFNRRFRFWLVVSLLVSNLAVGILSLYFLRSVNERYAALFERSIPVVNSLRTLTRELSFVQRLARRIIDPDNEPAWKELLPQMEDASRKALVHALDISNAELFRETGHTAAIVAMSREYDARVDEYLALARAGKLAQANQFNNEVLRPTYDNLQLRLDAAADHIEAQGNNLRDRYTQDTRFFGGLLLAFAGWPVLAAALGVFVLTILIVTLLLTIFTPSLGWQKRVAPPPGNT
jgi:hypothetical protein